MEKAATNVELPVDVKTGEFVMKIRKRVNAHQDGPETSALTDVNQVSTDKTARTHVNVSTARHAIT